MAEAAAKTSTAENTLQHKSAGPNVVPGGHLIAEASKAEGVDVRQERAAALAL